MEKFSIKEKIADMHIWICKFVSDFFLISIIFQCNPLVGGVSSETFINDVYRINGKGVQTVWQLHGKKSNYFTKLLWTSFNNDP